MENKWCTDRIPLSGPYTVGYTWWVYQYSSTIQLKYRWGNPHSFATYTLQFNRTGDPARYTLECMVPFNNFSFDFRKMLVTAIYHKLGDISFQASIQNSTFLHYRRVFKGQLKPHFWGVSEQTTKFTPD